MQTGIWMTNLDSTHFSDKFSYKILFIPSNGLKDMIFAICTFAAIFRKTGEKKKKTVMLNLGWT
jgi:hypothetical protein